MFRRILIPLDGSPKAELAIPVAAQIAHAHDSEILLMRTVDISHYVSWQGIGSPLDVGLLMENEVEGALDYLRDVAHMTVFRNLKVSIIVEEGRPELNILSTAKIRNVDLIVMNSHGYTGIKRWVLGGVAHAVERNSPIPVLILRDNAEEIATLLPDQKQPLHVLVALDGTKLAEQIIDNAAQLSIALSGSLPGVLHLAMVVPLVQDKGLSSSEYETAIATAQSYIRGVQQRLSRDPRYTNKLTVTSSISVQSNICDTLVRLAEWGQESEEVNAVRGYDVIAMATHGRKGVVDRMIHTSTTERVLDATRVPMLVVRPENDVSETQVKNSQTTIPVV